MDHSDPNVEIHEDHQLQRKSISSKDEPVQDVIRPNDISLRLE